MSVLNFPNKRPHSRENASDEYDRVLVEAGCEGLRSSNSDTLVGFRVSLYAFRG